MTDSQLAALVVTIVIGVWTARPAVVLVVAAAAVVVPRLRAVAVICLIVGLFACVRAGDAWNGVRADQLGPFTGWACLAADPAPQGNATLAVFEIEGERFQAWTRGSPRRRLDGHLSGECARIEGTRRPITGGAARRASIRHIVGGLELDAVGDWSSGSPVDRASNRVRRLIESGASHLPPPDDSLFAGLVIGDDRGQPPQLIEAFRASGLAHLTAVSGQNIAFVLAALTPLLRRLRPWPRVAATLVAITWFAALTRMEPSVLRAGAMAGVSALGVVLGRERPPTRTLTIAVGGLALVDPLLVWSVGFWLSVGATAGVAVIGARLHRILPGPTWLAAPLAVTIGAQLGVAPASLLVFGSLPLVSIPANLLAVPVAGAVMLYGLPAAIVAGAVGGPLATAIQLPSRVGTRWVATVAALGARLEPPAVWSLIGWGVVTVLLALCVVGRRQHKMCEGDVHGAAPDHR